MEPHPELLEFVLLLQSSEYLGVLTATEERLTDANDTFLNMIGYTRTEMESGLIDWRAMTPPEYIALDERGIEQVKEVGACVPFEKEYVTREGTRIPVLVGAIRLNEEPLEWAWWIVDLRSQRTALEAERRFDQMQGELKAELNGALRLHEITMRLGSKSSVQGILEEILDSTIELMGADFGNVQVLDGEVLRIVAQRNFPKEFLDYFHEVSHATTAACSTAFSKGRRVIVDDVERDPLFAGTESREVLLRSGIRSVQSTPLFGRDGKLFGVISTQFRVPRAHSERSLRYLDLLANCAAQVLERVQLRELERRADRLQTSAELANTLAHEINNPVQALTNIIELLSTQETVNGDIRKLVGLAQEQLERVEQTVRRLLTVDFHADPSVAPELLKLLDANEERRPRWKSTA